MTGFHDERRLIRFDMSEFMEEHSVIILTSNLGSGVVPKRRMGVIVEEGCGQNARATAEEAVRKHLRPELVNRLTKIVHFNPLGLDAAREILGKLVKPLNNRIADRGVTVELDGSAEDFILLEGFGLEYGARNLERLMDRLLGGPIAEKILDGIIAGEQVIRISYRP